MPNEKLQQIGVQNLFHELILTQNLLTFDLFSDQTVNNYPIESQLGRDLTKETASENRVLLTIYSFSQSARLLINL